MWSCPKCRKDVDVDFEVCWNCGTAQDGTHDPTFVRADAQPPSTAKDPASETSHKRDVPLTKESDSSTRFNWPVAILHFCCAFYVVIRIQADAHRPVSNPDENWVVGLFLVLMFPVNILAVIGAFRIGFLSLLLVPFASAFWGYAVGKVIQLFRAE